MIRYIPIQVHDGGVFCGGCSQRSHGDGVSDDWCRAFYEDLQTESNGLYFTAKRCPAHWPDAYGNWPKGDSK